MCALREMIATQEYSLVHACDYPSPALLSFILLDSRLLPSSSCISSFQHFFSLFPIITLHFLPTVLFPIITFFFSFSSHTPINFFHGLPFTSSLSFHSLSFYVFLRPLLTTVPLLFSFSRPCPSFFSWPSSPSILFHLFSLTYSSSFTKLLSSLIIFLPPRRLNIISMYLRSLYPHLYAGQTSGLTSTPTNIFPKVGNIKKKITNKYNDLALYVYGSS